MGLFDKLMHMVRDAMGEGGLRRHNGRTVKPASMDPMGDPADQMPMGYRQAGQGKFGNVKPASMDPMGDPADQMPSSRMKPGSGRFGNVKPASMDPLGDPADQGPGKMGWRR